ncbi:hypothetical protein HYX07_03450 [Candidatus Woesearchaeota archaeon]|nr:hypothetical protein [Candidatus Woesearchaeota archaeon]
MDGIDDESGQLSRLRKEIEDDGETPSTIRSPTLISRLREYVGLSDIATVVLTAIPGYFNLQDSSLQQYIPVNLDSALFWGPPIIRGLKDAIEGAASMRRYASFEGKGLDLEVAGGMALGALRDGVPQAAKAFVGSVVGYYAIGKGVKFLTG